MKQRLAIILCSLTTAISATTVASVASAPAASARGWACVAADGVNAGVCINDPTPHPLPVIVLPI